MQDIRELYAYNRWANHRTLDAVVPLDEEAFTRDLGSSFASVRDTLAHVLAAEWVWLRRWRGSSPTGTPEDWDLSTLEAIRGRWAEVEREREEFLSGLTDEDLHRAMAYRNTAGEAFENTMGQMLRHVVNHSSYHRGQVVTMLRQLGAEPAGTDLIQFYRERATVPVGPLRGEG